VSARGSAAADGVLLNANEAPVSLHQEPLWESLHLNRYPDPQPAALRERLAELYGVEPTRLLVTRGSDEGIDLLLRVFCRPGVDAILESPPCFGMYRVAAQVQGARVAAVPRDPGSFAPDVDALAGRIATDDSIRLVFLTSPNNPTGDLLGRAELKRLLAACANRALLVLDEAYIEFCEADSAATLVRDYPQLVVLRTLSKAWASAGLRCGATIAHPEVIALLRRVMAPYPLSAPAIAAALAVTDLAARPAQQRMLEALKLEKSRLVDFLAALPYLEGLWPGQANFVLIRVADGPALVRFLALRGVRVRDFDSQPSLRNCVRLTVGSAADMQALRAALSAWEVPS